MASIHYNWREIVECLSKEEQHEAIKRVRRSCDEAIDSLRATHDLDLALRREETIRTVGGCELMQIVDEFIRLRTLVMTQSAEMLTLLSWFEAWIEERPQRIGPHPQPWDIEI